MLLKEKLEEAQEKKRNDIKSFVWKGRKSYNGEDTVQESKHMVDATDNELRQWYNQCTEMLYNESKTTPGRYPLLKIVEDQQLRCNAELFLRWLENDKKTPRFTFMSALREFMNNNPKAGDNDIKDAPISIAVGDCPKEFMKIPIGLVFDACLDSLGKFDKKHITLSFILRQGVYLTKEEAKQVTGSKAEFVKEYLELEKTPIKNIRVSYKGLSLQQMKAMVNLPKFAKYSELSTVQLQTLRDRILFTLEDDIRYHIGQWEELIRQLKLVASSRGITL